MHLWFSAHTRYKDSQATPDGRAMSSSSAREQTADPRGAPSWLWAPDPVTNLGVRTSPGP